MNFFRKLFGQKPSPASDFSATPPAAPQAAPASGATPAEEVVVAHDAYGRELSIPKSEWRTKLLPAKLTEFRDQPDQLATVIAQSIRDGFSAEVVEAAAHLAGTDTNRERGHILHAAVLLELKRPADAEVVLRSFVEKQGETGAALAHLAKTRADQGDQSAAADLLWRAIQLDPNQEQAFVWYVGQQRENARPAETPELAEKATFDALCRIAELPESWRARIWLARHSLGRRDLHAALKLYEEAIDHAPRPVPADLLQQMSGDLGNHAHLPEILHLAAPYYDVSRHGLPTGLNILKAYHDLGQLDAASRFLDRLYAQKRPDWKQALAFWDAEIVKSRRSVETTPPAPPRVSASVTPSASEAAATAPIQAPRPAQAEPMQVTLLAVEGPVWLPPESPAVELFAAKANDASLVAFLGASAEIPPPPTAGAPQNAPEAHARLADAAGRLSRALPLYLAEQVEFSTPALARVLVPWMVKPRPGFILGGVPWDDATAARHARAVVPDDAADYLFVTHLRCVGETWAVELRLVRTIDAACLATASLPCSPADPGQALPALASAVLEALAAHTDITPATSNEITPTASSSYLLRLEQLLAVRTAGIEPAKSTLHGEREILDGQLRLCLEQPANLPVRLLFVHTLKAMKRLRPEIIPEFKERIELLQRENPLQEPAQSVATRLFAEIFSA